MLPSIIRAITTPLLLIISATLSAESDCAKPEGTCTLGIWPHTSVRQIETTYATVAEELSLVLDRQVEVRTSRSVARFLERVAAKEFDLIVAGSMQYLHVARRAGYQPLARREQPLTFIIVTHEDSTLAQVSQLRGRKLGITSDNNGVTVATLKLLLDHGFTDREQIELVRFNTQLGCAHALATGLVDACGMSNPVREMLEFRLDQKFRQLARSGPVPNVAYMSAAHLSAELSLSAQQYLAAREGFKEASPNDYRPFSLWIRQAGRLQ